MHGNMVLPPLGPLFTNHTTQNHSHGHHRQLVAVAATETLHVTAALRTPTSGHAHAYLHGGAFPSSSPVKKDMNSNAAASTKKMSDHHHKKSHAGMSSSVLNLDSPKAVDAAKDEDEDEDFGSASPTCEDEKLRLSRERNRLHAQRTRIRKRELLESLKERIHALQSEHLLLKQAYEFHATAVCLLSLSGGPECDHPSIKHIEDVSEAALELFDSTSTLNACLDDEDDLDDFHSSCNGHEKGCEWYNESDESDHQDQQQNSESSCSCQQDASQLNSNGKRSHPSSQTGGSKEEREQLRRERNRLHARRARLRKKLILERSQQVCCSLC